MADAAAIGLSASLVIASHQLMAPPMPTPVQPHALGPNLNAPGYVNPTVSFDPVTNIVIFTFRNPDSGKVVEQIPPSEILSRYRFADESGIPNPLLPRSISIPDPLAGLRSQDTGSTPPPTPDLGPAPAPAKSTPNTGSPFATFA